MLKTIAGTALAIILSNAALAAEPTVIMVSEGNEYVVMKTTCGQFERDKETLRHVAPGRQAVDPCNGKSPEVMLRELHETLAAEFAASPECHGLEFVWFTGTEHVGSYWHLYISLADPDEGTSRWYLYGPSGKSPERHDSIPNIIRKACIIANGLGGKVR
jgi:hypothetical protein